MYRSEEHYSSLIADKDGKIYGNQRQCKVYHDKASVIKILEKFADSIEAFAQYTFPLVLTHQSQTIQ